jgi:hypothetical protein
MINFPVAGLPDAEGRMIDTVVGTLKLDEFYLADIEASVGYGRISFEFGTGEAWRGQRYTLTTPESVIEFVVDRLHLDQSDAYGETEVVHGAVVKTWKLEHAGTTIPPDGTP